MTFSVLFCCERKWTKINSVLTKKCCYLNLRSKVSTQGDVVNYTTVACRISSWLKWYKNCENRLRLAEVIVKNKMSRFLWFTVYSYSTASSRRVSDETYFATNNHDTSRYLDLSDYWIVAGRAGACVMWLWSRDGLADRHVVRFFDVSDIHISDWHHKRFTIAVWYLDNDWLAISVIAGKRHRRCARTGLLPVPSTTTTLGRSFVVAGPVIWNSLPATLRTATISPPTLARYLKAHLFGWLTARLSTIHDALYQSTHHHHISDCELQPILY